MPDFRAKTHQKIDFGWGSALDPAGGAYSAPPDPLAGFGGPTSKGKEREEREGKGQGGERRGREGRGGKGKERRKGRGGRLLFQTFLGPVVPQIRLCPCFYYTL